MALTQGVARDALAPMLPIEMRLAAAGVVFKHGSIVGIDTADGLLKLGAVSTTLNVIGICCVDKDTTGLAAEDRWIPVQPGTFGWFTSHTGDDAIAADDETKDCYVVDDDVVALTSATNTRSRAGRIYQVDPDTGYIAVQFEVIR